MQYRILKPEEYDLLKSIPEPDAVKVNPNNTFVAAAFDEKKIVGRAVAISLPHIEAIWVDPEYRKGMIGKKLHSMIADTLQEHGAKLLIAYAINKKMESYLQRLGYSQLATAWIKEL